MLWITGMVTTKAMQSFQQQQQGENQKENILQLNKVILSILPSGISNNWGSVVILGIDISNSVVSLSAGKKTQTNFM